jgi:molecular chaperone HtpG
MWDRQARHGVKLYVRRVFIMDDAEKLMPLYLRFVRGIVDSNDLPLNVSREILQESKDIDTLRAGCTKKVLGLLEDLAENQKDKYTTFWKEFGQVLKEGVGEDHANGEDRRPAAPPPRCRHRRGSRVAGRLHRPHEGRPGQDLLRHRRQLQRRQEQPAPGDLPQEGHRGAAAVRPGG